MSFSGQINTFVNKAKAQTVDVPRKSILELYGMIIRQTPVGHKRYWAVKRAPKGYVGGRLRNNWNLSLTNIDETTTSSTNDGVASAKADQRIKSYKGHTVYLSNHLPYALRVERGHSPKQAPHGMVRVSVKRWKRIVRGNI